jgi:hypothetical protein
MKAEPQKPKIIIDTNKHGIRREMPAAGYRALKALNKKNKKKNVSHETK